jgi:hypothetical protein
MGVSVKTIRRWRQEGMPSEDWGFARNYFFLPSACIEWARTRSTVEPAGAALHYLPRQPLQEE